MDLTKIGEKLSDWVDGEWYMGFFAIFTIILIFMIIKMAKEINSSKRFQKSNDNKNSNHNG